jgi:hypothetical protein
VSAGAEASVIKGMSQSLGRFRPRALVAELKAHSLERAGTTETHLHDLLASSGYQWTGQTLPFGNAVFRPNE